MVSRYNRKKTTRRFFWYKKKLKKKVRYSRTVRNRYKGIYVASKFIMIRYKKKIQRFRIKLQNIALIKKYGRPRFVLFFSRMIIPQFYNRLHPIHSMQRHRFIAFKKRLRSKIFLRSFIRRS